MVKFQPDSALVQWFKQRTEHAKGSRKPMIVALGSLNLHPTIAVDAHDGGLLGLVEAVFLSRVGGKKHLSRDCGTGPKEAGPTRPTQDPRRSPGLPAGAAGPRGARSRSGTGELDPQRTQHRGSPQDDRAGIKKNCRMSRPERRRVQSCRPPLQPSMKCYAWRLSARCCRPQRAAASCSFCAGACGGGRRRWPPEAPLQSQFTHPHSLGPRVTNARLSFTCSRRWQ
jgi:hypothetical protein